VSYLVGSPREDFFLARRANSTTIDIRALNQTPPPPPVVETPAQPPVVETPAQPPVIKAPAQPPVIDLPVNVSDLFRTTAINPTTNLAGTVNRPGSQNVFNSPLGRTNFNNAVSRLINPSVTGDRASWGINRNPFV
jgi:hypothetical protein